MKFPSKISIEDRTNKQTNRVLMFKAVNNAAVGFPISASLNVVITLPFSIYFISAGLPEWSYPLLLGAPFVIVSVVRQFLIDYYLAVYNIDCDPSHLIKKYVNILVKKSKSS